MRSSFYAFLVSAGLIGVGVRDAVGHADTPALPPERQYQALVEEYERGEKEAIHASQAANTDEERERILERETRPLVRRYAARMIELAAHFPKDPVALRALSWSALESDWPSPERDQAILILSRDFATRNDIASLCKKLVYAPSPEAERFLRKASQVNPAEEVKTLAAYYLARNLHEQTKGGPARQTAAPRLDAEAEKMFVALAAQHGNVALPGEKQTLGQAIEKDLFEIRHLSVGKAAPDISGKDIDGRAFKLTDYRGKVVLLDFWGHW
jgi:hypothetical protein